MKSIVSLQKKVNQKEILLPLTRSHAIGSADLMPLDYIPSG